jgi:anti-sigma factor RsiW
MICERCNSRLSAYIDGMLSAAEVRELNEHLAECRRCRDDLREIQAVRTILRRLPEHEARPGFWDDALRTVRVRGRKRRVQWSPRYAASAAAAALALAALVVMTHHDQAGDSMPNPADVPAAVINPVSFVSLHARERARSPLIDMAKLRFAGDEAEAADISEDGRFDVQ